MPYYVYRVGTLGVLTKLAEFPAFRDASAFAKTQRVADAAGATGRVKVMFADNELAAEDLLGQVREPGPALPEDD
ncbi:MAG: hypothetical protein MUC32_02805 [Burkholderiaceae bacterium]|nr:hypothetical protein [Burkholderiaceae bacterium]